MSGGKSFGEDHACNCKTRFEVIYNEFEPHLDTCFPFRDVFALDCERRQTTCRLFKELPLNTH